MMISPSVINMELNKPFSIRCNLSINPSLLYDAQDQRDQTSKPTLKWSVSTMLGVNPDDVTRMQTIYEDYSRDPASLPDLKIRSALVRSGQVRSGQVRSGQNWWQNQVKLGMYLGIIQVQSRQGRRKNCSKKSRTVVKISPRRSQGV